MDPILIAVGSLNHVKTQAAFDGFSKLFNNRPITIHPFDVQSSVRQQPFGDDETLAGAKHRAVSAFDSFFQNFGRKVDYAIGLEGGISSEDADVMECFAWVVIYDGKSFGQSKTGTFLLPPGITALVKSGMELGAADDLFFGREKSGQTGGTVGYLTKDLISRTLYYEPSVILAFVPFFWSELYGVQTSAPSVAPYRSET